MLGENWSKRSHSPLNFHARDAALFFSTLQLSPSLIFFISSIDICTVWKAILCLRPTQDPVRLTCGFCSP
jgi:hypothetical protein